MGTWELCFDGHNCLLTYFQSIDIPPLLPIFVKAFLLSNYKFVKNLAILFVFPLYCDVKPYLLINLLRC